MSTHVDLRERLAGILMEFSSRESLGYSDFRDIFFVVFFLGFLRETKGGLHGSFFGDECRDVSSLEKAAQEADEMLGEGFYLKDMVAGFIRGSGSNIRSLPEFCSSIIKFLSEPEVFRHAGVYFDYAIEVFFEAEGRRGGESYTPRSVVSLMVGMVKPVGGEKIYDPVCGSGGFLVEVYRQFLQSNGEADVELYGGELNLSLARIAKINTYLHGAKEAKIKVGNSLLERERGRFDVVLANPPFSVSGWDNGRDEIHAFKYGSPPKSNADYAFVQMVFEALNEKGRAAILVPMGVLFRGGVEGEIRSGLVKDGALSGVISLPSGTLLGTSIPVAILFFNKGLESENRVFFIDAVAVCKALKDERSINGYAEAALFAFENRLELRGASRIVGLAEIEGNEFNLSLARYISAEEKAGCSLAELLASQSELEMQLRNLQEEFYSLLSGDEN